MSKELISLMDAAEKGIHRLRKPNWVMPEDHIKIDIIDGVPGPWAELYSPMNAYLNGQDPRKFVLTEPSYTKQYVPYTGPLPESQEYLEEKAHWLEVMNSKGNL